MKTFRPKKRAASVLFAVLAILLFAGIGVMMTTGATTHELRSSKRAFDRMQAFYAAEAGVQHAIQWFNQPGSGPVGLPVRDPETGTMFDSQGNSVITTDWSADEDDIIHLTAGSDGDEVARVVDLEVSPSAAGRGGVAIVRSTGETPSGVQATITVTLEAPNPSPFLIPAALMTEGLAASGGHFAVHWGEIWGQGDVECPQNWDRWPKSSEDRWFKTKVEGRLLDHKGTEYADGRETGGNPDGFVADPIASNASNYYVPFRYEDLYKVTSKKGTDMVVKNPDLANRENLLQHQTLPWPDFSYETIKAMVLDNGYSYFKVTEDGLIYDPVTRQTRTFEDTFSRIVADGVDNNVEITDPDQIPRDTMPPVIFIDTPDGTNPEAYKAAHNGELPEIRLAGQSENFYYGLFFMGANFTSNGQGDGHTYDHAEKPDMTLNEEPIDILAYGLLMTYGKMTVTGNPGCYGAVYATDGFDGGGFWNIWYDHRLNEERRMTVDYRVTAALWDVK